MGMHSSKVHIRTHTHINSHCTSYTHCTSYCCSPSRRFTGLDLVTDDLSNALHARYPQHRFTVMYVAGEDLLRRCRFHKTLMDKYPIVGIARPSENNMKRHSEFAMYSVHPSKGPLAASSTEMRKRIANEQALDDLTFPSVVEYWKELRACKQQN
jgi:nicotinic acid mononucleotide adenylyltransferase